MLGGCLKRLDRCRADLESFRMKIVNRVILVFMTLQTKARFWGVPYSFASCQYFFCSGR